MSIINSDLKIGERLIPLKNQFIMILGDFNEELKNHIEYYKSFRNIQNFNHIPLDNLLDFSKYCNLNIEPLRSYDKLINLLYNLKKSTMENLQFLQEYNLSLKNLNLFMKSMELRSKKEALIDELKLSKIKSKTSEISAKKDLITKLISSIRENQKKLEYLEEDYNKIRSKRNDLLNLLNRHKESINDLNKARKDCFNEINQIIRKMEQPLEKNNDVIDNTSKPLSNSERIKLLRKKAKDYHYDIKDMKSKLNDIKTQKSKIEPKFQLYKKDYDSLFQKIENDKKTLIELQTEISNINNNEAIDTFTLHNSFDIIRSSEEIEYTIKKIEDQLDTINKDLKNENQKQITDISNIVNQFENLKDKLDQNKNTMLFSPENEELINSIEAYRQLEIVLSDIEDKVNKLLMKIDLDVHFQIIMIEGENRFILETSFSRSGKETCIFEELTTPEKVFFVISFYITIHIVGDLKNILFSNLFINQNFNKRGSLFRTFRKILSLFEDDEEFKKFKLILIISNLEMKKPIDKFKIIKI